MKIKILSQFIHACRMLSRFKEVFITNALCCLVLFSAYIFMLSSQYCVTQIDIRTNELTKEKLN
jgi:hypothetical protein